MAGTRGEWGDKTTRNLTGAVALMGVGQPALSIAEVWLTAVTIVVTEEEEDEDGVLDSTCIFPSTALNEAITTWSTSASSVPLPPSCLYLTSPTSCPIVATNAGSGSVFVDDCSSNSRCCRTKFTHSELEMASVLSSSAFVHSGK